MKILHFPLMKITIWFILGIVFSYYLNPKPSTTFLITGLFFVPFILTLFFAKRDFIQKIYFGFATYFLFFQIFFQVKARNLRPKHVQFGLFGWLVFRSQLQRWCVPCLYLSASIFDWKGGHQMADNMFFESWNRMPRKAEQDLWKS